MNNPTEGLSREHIARLDAALAKHGLEPAKYRSKLISALVAGASDVELAAIAATIIPVQPLIQPPSDLPASAEHHEERFQRFNVSTRVQHAIMAFSVIILIVTGLPIKFHESAISIAFMNAIGGIQVSSLIHRVGAVGLIFVGAFHLIYISATRAGRRDFLLMLPLPKDMFDALQMMKYYFGRSNDRAKFGRFSYIEKFDYWAVYWGMVIMISSGALLWFQETALKFLPMSIIEIATVAHSDEALLATLAIVIWHFYNVHFSPSKFPMSKVFIHGQLTLEEMEEEHPLELDAILASRAKADRSHPGGGK